MKGLPLALALLAAAAGCRPPESGPVLARVNGEAVVQAHVDAERAWAQPWAPADAELLEDLIDQALILQVARREGISLDGAARREAEALALGGTDKALLLAQLEAAGHSYADWARRIHRAALIDDVVRRQVRNRLQLDPQEVQDHYWEQLPSYRTPERRALRQIFTRGRSEAHKARNELELGEPFEQVAARRGQGPEAADGGALGPLSLRSLPKELAKAAAALKPGQRSPIIASPWGWHILYLEARVPGASQTLEQAAPHVRERLLRQKELPAYQAWLARLREQAAIERLVSYPTPKKGRPRP